MRKTFKVLIIYFTKNFVLIEVVMKYICLYGFGIENGWINIRNWFNIRCYHDRINSPQFLI